MKRLTDTLDSGLSERNDRFRSLDLDLRESLSKVLEASLQKRTKKVCSAPGSPRSYWSWTDLEMKLSSSQNDVFSGFLNESLDTGIGLVEKTKTLDELGKVGWRKEVETRQKEDIARKPKKEDAYQGSWVPERLERWEATERRGDASKSAPISPLRHRQPPAKRNLTVMITPAKLTNPAFNSSWSSCPVAPFESKAHNVAFLQTFPSNPPTANTFPAGTVSTATRSLPIIM